MLFETFMRIVFRLQYSVIICLLFWPSVKVEAIASEMGALACGFEPGNLYSSYARDLKGLDVQNCGWENYECKEKVDLVTAFHVFEHLTDPLKALQKAVSWLKTNGLIYIEVPNMANGLKLKGFGSLHMAHTIGFGRYSLELLGAFTGMVPLEVFDEYDIGIIFKKCFAIPTPIFYFYALLHASD